MLEGEINLNRKNVEHCLWCKGEIEPGLSFVCTCYAKYHLDCAQNESSCPSCQSTKGFNSDRSLEQKVSADPKSSSAVLAPIPNREPVFANYGIKDMVKSTGRLFAGGFSLVVNGIGGVFEMAGAVVSGCSCCLVPVLLIGGVVGVLYVKDQEDTQKLVKQLNESPPNGVIAYTIDNQIKYFDAKDIFDANRKTQAIQLRKGITDVLWMNEKEITYYAAAENGPSQHIYTVNLETKVETEVFNPYSEAATEVFGDVAKKEAELKARAAEEKRKHEEKIRKAREEGKRVRAFYKAPRIIGLPVQDLAYDSKTKRILAKLSDEWYVISTKGLKKAKDMPSPIPTNQFNSPSGRYKVIEPTMFHSSAYLTNSAEEGGVDIENSSKHPAWRAE